MAFEIEFKIIGLPATTNSSSRKCWQAKAKEARKWKEHVFNAVLIAHSIPKSPLTKAKLTLVRHSSAEPDFDGLVSSFKHVIDGLIHAKVLVNDKVSNIGQPTYLWKLAKRNKGFIQIKVEEV